MRGLLVVLGMIAVGCGSAITPLGLHDQRLPPDARRWVADAEDAVVVARARLSDARREADATDAWGARLRAGLPLPGAGADAGQKLEAMLMARTTAVAAQTEQAEAALGLARARLRQAYAETAMRYDLDVYDPGPIEAEVADALARVKAARQATDGALAQLGTADTAWWTAYRAFVGAGGDATSIWVNR